MVCPFCTNSLKNALDAESYIQEVRTIDIEQGRVEIVLKNENTDSLQELKEKLGEVVKKATFILDDIES